jgi:putative membrane protein
MNSPLAHLLVRWLVLALGVVIATHLIPGIHCSDVGALIAVVVLLSFFNAILRPILVLFTLPFIIVTMGLGIVVINAILFLFVGRLVDGFTVTGFWPAVGGSLVLSATNFVVSA